MRFFYFSSRADDLYCSTVFFYFFIHVYQLSNVSLSFVMFEYKLKHSFKITPILFSPYNKVYVFCCIYLHLGSKAWSVLLKNILFTHLEFNSSLTTMPNFSTCVISCFYQNNDSRFDAQLGGCKCVFSFHKFLSGSVYSLWVHLHIFISVKFCRNPSWVKIVL